MDKRKMIGRFLVILLLQMPGIAKAQDAIKSIDILFGAITHGNRFHFSGSMAVSEGDKIIYQNSAGYADINTKRPNTTSTNFSLASLSKVFTAVAVLQLKEAGKISLDDHFIKYFPDFPFADVTIRQVISHTSGLPDFEIFDEVKPATATSFSFRDVITAIQRHPKLLFTPGTEWHYSNVGFALLALLVEKVSGQSFPDYMRRNIFQRAGMLNTYIDVDDAGLKDKDKATLYVNSRSPRDIAPTDALKENPLDPIQTVAGPGLVVSSVTDLLKFGNKLLNYRLLNEATTREMWTVAKLNNGEPAQLSHAPLYNALGWGIDIDTSSGTIASHTGGGPGISTIMLINVTKKQVVIVLENTDNPAPLSLGINSMNLLNHKPLMRFRED
jgi:CubicO group peptidase (beta-lactamase class C family)